MGGYRRDLQDLGSGIRLETAALRKAAARAAAVLPGALEAGASAASNRLESVGQAVDDLGAAAAVLLSHANEALQSAEIDSEDGDGGSRPSDAAASGASWRASLSSKKYTRFEAQVLALRADPTIFTEEPEDAEGFARWRGSFAIGEVKLQIEGVLRESPGLESFVEKLVPSVVDYETFWCRYFFAVNKLRQAEDVRTKLVSRAMSKEDNEELSWDVDDDDDDNNVGDQKEDTDTMAEKREVQIAELVNHEPDSSEKQAAVVENNSAEDKETDLAAAKDGNGESNGETATPKSSDGPGREEKAEAGDSSKESDFSVVSRPSTQEEDLSWEEIENVSDQDEKKGGSPRSSSASKVEDLRKRLNSVEDDEDLSWDVDE
uniref:BSD domain-containing protein n=1 Tax=Arundo donax TaxID=35708 RepID=A0A0A9GI18_ARUDO